MARRRDPDPLGSLQRGLGKVERSLGKAERRLGGDAQRGTRYTVEVKPERRGLFSGFRGTLILLTIVVVVLILVSIGGPAPPP